MFYFIFLYYFIWFPSPSRRRGKESRGRGGKGERGKISFTSFLLEEFPRISFIKKVNFAFKDIARGCGNKKIKQINLENCNFSKLLSARSISS